LNAKQVSELLAKDAANVASYLLPGGKKAGAEFKAGSTGGEPGNSLSVRLTGSKAGVWRDFATEQGGDLLDLFVAVKGYSFTEALADAKRFLNVVDQMPERKPVSYVKPQRPKNSIPVSRVRDWLNGRGVTDETIEAFKVREVQRNGAVWALFPYLRDGVYINGKYRNPDDKKGMQQEKDAEPCLFGWHLVQPKDRTIIITEGEIDAMTLWQAGLTALSVNAGANNHQWIENDWERLERFSEIVIAFDHDEQGDKGAVEIMKRLGVERCKRMKMGAKDANQWLMEGATDDDFKAAMLSSKAQDPDEMKFAGEFMNRLLSMFYPAADADKHPKLRLDKDFEWFDFRPGELTVWTGYNGHGKSLLLSQVQLGLMAQGERFVVFSGEMQPEYLLKRLVKQATGLDRPTPAYIGEVFNWLNDRFWIFNQVGSATMKRLIEVFTYANKRYGVKHVVIDSLMMTDVPEDGPGAMTLQKEAIRNLCDFAKKSGVHVHLVAHPRKGKDESAGPGKSDVAGSSKITDGADNVFVVWRSQKDQAEPNPCDEAAHDKWVELQESPDAKLILKKQRNGDHQDYTQSLWFDRESMQYRTQKRNHKDVRYVDFSQTS
jgi:twinkle protein